MEISRRAQRLNIRTSMSGSPEVVEFSTLAQGAIEVSKVLNVLHNFKISRDQLQPISRVKAIDALNFYHINQVEYDDDYYFLGNLINKADTLREVNCMLLEDTRDVDKPGSAVEIEQSGIDLNWIAELLKKRQIVYDKMLVLLRTCENVNLVQQNLQMVSEVEQLRGYFFVEKFRGIKEQLRRINEVDKMRDWLWRQEAGQKLLYNFLIGQIDLLPVKEILGHLPNSPTAELDKKEQILRDFVEEFNSHVLRVSQQMDQLDTIQLAEEVENKLLQYYLYS